MTSARELSAVDYGSTIRSVDRETAALLSRLLGGFLEIDLQGQPLMGGLTGGHVLTHLAREADRMADEILAATGRPLPPVDTARRWDVDQGGLRPGAVLIDDVMESSERLSEAMHGVSDWPSLDRAVRALPGRRLVQLLIHHSDLSRPWDQVSEQDALNALSWLPVVMPAELASFRLDARPGRTSLVVESVNDETVIVGDACALLAWASGRADSADASLPTFNHRIWF